MKSKLYKGIIWLEFLGTCSHRDNAEIAEPMKLIANKKKVHKLLRSFGFDTECSFSIKELGKYWDPFKYYISEEYINLVHSDIDHIFKIYREEQNEDKKEAYSENQIHRQNRENLNQ